MMLRENPSLKENISKERIAAPLLMAGKAARRKYDMSKCIITVPSMTFAQKARNALTANQIPSTVTRLTPEQAEKGCGWGVEIDCRHLEHSLHVLNTSNIPTRRVRRREGP